jgi:hypothetical protein
LLSNTDQEQSSTHATRGNGMRDRRSERPPAPHGKSAVRIRTLLA